MTVQGNNYYCLWKVERVTVFCYEYCFNTFSEMKCRFNSTARKHLNTILYPELGEVISSGRELEAN